MGYFQNINSLAELKKSYRVLALQNHPDKGGSTETMQQINLEFERLYAKWKDDTTVSAAASGYENDYAGASANEYTEYVYNEYRWKGRNYNGQMRGEIVEIIRKWLKETYPRYKFSVTQNGYRSINIYLVKADFEAFTKESGLIYKDINHYHIGTDRTITERAREVMLNVCDFTMSYNYDNSDIMTDYFDTNFYLTLGIGRYDKPYQTELPKLQTKDKLPEVFKHPEGAAHKAIRQALGKARFDFIQSRANAGKLILGEDTYGSKGEHYFWPKQYSSAKTAQKRIDKLTEAGMRCRMTGYNGGCIEFLGSKAGTGTSGIYCSTSAMEGKTTAFGSITNINRKKIKIMKVGDLATLIRPYRGYRNIELVERLQYTWLVRICESGLEIEVYEDEFTIDEP